MLQHVSLGIADLAFSGAFSDAALAPLGDVRVFEDICPGSSDQAVGSGLPGGGDTLALTFQGADARPRGPGFHLAFAAPDSAAVAAFHRAAVAVGGTDNGAPAFARMTGRAIMPPSSSIPTATGWKRFSRCQP